MELQAETAYRKSRSPALALCNSFRFTIRRIWIRKPRTRRTYQNLSKPIKPRSSLRGAGDPQPKGYPKSLRAALPRARGPEDCRCSGLGVSRIPPRAQMNPVLQLEIRKVGHRRQRASDESGNGRSQARRAPWSEYVGVGAVPACGDD